MVIVEVATHSEVEEIIKDDDLYARISDDTSPDKENLVIPDLDIALSGYVKGKLASLYIIFPEDNKMHFMVKKEFRGHSRKLLEKSFNYYNRAVYCIIPLHYDDVIKFAINSKFKIREIVKDYRRICGQLCDGVVLFREPNWG